MKVQLINLGRNKVNEIVYPADMKVLQRIINKHVLTTCWTLEKSPKEENEYYVCEVDLDEDDMVRFLKGDVRACPYYQSDDEYKIVRKQI